MFYRFKVADGDDVTFTAWREESPLNQQAEADKVKAVNELRAANPEATISIERSQRTPNDGQ